MRNFVLASLSTNAIAASNNAGKLPAKSNAADNKSAADSSPFGVVLAATAAQDAKPRNPISDDNSHVAAKKSEPTNNDVPPKEHRDTAKTQNAKPVDAADAKSADTKATDTKPAGKSDSAANDNASTDQTAQAQPPQAQEVQPQPQPPQVQPPQADPSALAMAQAQGSLLQQNPQLAATAANDMSDAGQNAGQNVGAVGSDSAKPQAAATPPFAGQSSSQSAAAVGDQAANSGTTPPSAGQNAGAAGNDFAKAQAAVQNAALPAAGDQAAAGATQTSSVPSAGNSKAPAVTASAAGKSGDGKNVALSDNGAKLTAQSDSAAPQAPQTQTPQTQTPQPQTPQEQAAAQAPPSSATNSAVLPVMNFGTPVQNAASVAVSNTVQISAHAGDTAATVNTLAVAIAAKTQSGARQFDIRLDPPELGRVEVRLSIDASGKTEAHMTADQPETLNLLQKDSSSLTQALRDAGLDVSQSGLNFSLRGQSGQNSGDNNPDRGARTNLTASRAIDTAQGAASAMSFTGGAEDGRVDIHV